MNHFSDNRFNTDSISVRLSRLMKIKNNFTRIQSELQSPDYIAAWAVTAYDDFYKVVVEQEYRAKLSTIATAILDEKFRETESVYQSIKMLARSIYSNDPLNLKEFDFDSRFPYRKNDKLPRFNKVISVHERHVAMGLTHLIPDDLISRLIAAKTELETAINDQSLKNTEAERSLMLRNERFRSDTDKLVELRSWFYLKMGRDNFKIQFLGMRNPKKAGRIDKVNPPDGLEFDWENKILKWNLVEKATSYQLVREDEEKLDEIYQGADNFYKFRDNNYLGNYKVRARNLKGFGEFCEVLEII